MVSEEQSIAIETVAGATNVPMTSENAAIRAGDPSMAVGRGITDEEVTELQNLLPDTHPGPHSHDYFDDYVIYDIVEGSALRARIQQTAERWISDKSNIERAAQGVGRRIPTTSSPLIRDFCVFQLKEWAEHPPHPPSSLGVDDHEPQAVVFIALEDLNPQNGFFMELKQGFDVCLDSRSKINFPKSGGGRGVFIALNL